jgi:hypothetical protein
MMNQGDRVSLTMHDTAQGLRVEIADHTTHQSGSMTASARNGFGQIKFAPAPSTECTSPRTGPRFRDNYPRSAFEADLPRIEAPDLGGPCNRLTGEGCTLIPRRDGHGATRVVFNNFHNTLDRNPCPARH